MYLFLVEFIVFFCIIFICFFGRDIKFKGKEFILLGLVVGKILFICLCFLSIKFKVIEFFFIVIVCWEELLIRFLICCLLNIWFRVWVLLVLWIKCIFKFLCCSLFNIKLKDGGDEWFLKVFIWCIWIGFLFFWDEGKGRFIR